MCGELKFMRGIGVVWTEPFTGTASTQVQMLIPLTADYTT